MLPLVKTQRPMIKKNNLMIKPPADLGGGGLDAPPPSRICPPADPKDPSFVLF